MICCKIVTNFSSQEGNFAGLLERLGNRGAVLWEQGVLYFADVEKDTDEKKIVSILKKSGYKKSFIDEYCKDNPPHENEYVDGWINDKLIRICYNKCEQESVEVFKNVSKGLDILNAEIDKIEEQNSKKKKSKDKLGD